MKVAWRQARSQVDGTPSSSSGGPTTARSKMPDGVEANFRTMWKERHAFNVFGGWLANEDRMTKIYIGLVATPAFLHFPDISALVRKSDLQQIPERSHADRAEPGDVGLHIRTLHQPPRVLVAGEGLSDDSCFFVCSEAWARGDHVHFRDGVHSVRLSLRGH